jgi:hypothetical protein
MRERHHPLPIAIDDDARGRFRCPRYRPHRGEVRHQQQILIDLEAVVVDLAIIAGDALDEDRFRHPQVVLQKFTGRKKLAPRNAGNVGNDRLDFVDLVLDQPLFGISRHKSPAALLRVCKSTGERH